ncbi:MAG: response regulator [Gammaproteobacteria bacterium]
MTRWQAQREARLAETQLNRHLAINDTTTDLVATIDIDGFLISLNAAGYAMLGLHDNTDISHLRLAGFLDNASVKNFVSQEIPQAIKFGASHCEVQITPCDGKPIAGSQVLIVHKDPLGNVDCFSVVLRDISDIKVAEKERQSLIEQLHQTRKMETIGRLAGGVAHDFNNFITVIMGYAELSMMNAERNLPNKEEIEMVLDTARKAARLSSQLLDLSSKQMVEPQVLNLNETIHNSLKLIESLLGEGITIDVRTDYALWPIKIDCSQLEQIILNLTVNARDAMRNSGVCTFSTENIELDREQASKLGVIKPGQFVRLIITDTGCGIPKESLEQIFDPFFSTKEKGKGTGLGLSAVFGAVKQNNGQIKVKSEVGKGATFEVYFPKAEGEPESQQHNPGDAEQQLKVEGSESILLVEDNEAVRNLLTTVLTELGYEVTVAINGAHALDVIDATDKPFDLVVSDVIMPKMNGMELYRELKKRSNDTKVVLMSGHTDQAICFQELNQGNINLLSKPFPSQKFAETVRDVLDNH